jgi:hypothetical protein
MAFRDINRGPELKIMYDNLRLYEAKSREEKAAAYKTATKNTTKAKHTRVKAYILPFDAKAGQYLDARVLASTQDGTGKIPAELVAGLVGGQFKAALTTGENSFKAPKYKFARLIATQRTATATTETPSRFTKNPYKHHTTVSASSSFGASAATQTYAEAVNLIIAKPALGTFKGTPGNSISFDPQG